MSVRFATSHRSEETYQLPVRRRECKHEDRRDQEEQEVSAGRRGSHQSQNEMRKKRRKGRLLEERVLDPASRLETLRIAETYDER
jgi:hypothetical protein